MRPEPSSHENVILKGNLMPPMAFLKTSSASNGFGSAMACPNTNEIRVARGLRLIPLSRTDLLGQSICFGHLGDELTRDSDVVEYEWNFDSVGRTHVSASLGRFPIEAIDEGRGTRLHDLTFGELPSVSRARMIGRNENV